MQASLIERCEHRDTYHLVGRAHDVGFWKTEDNRMPRLESARSYYSQELYPSEKKWLPALFDPFCEARDDLNRCSYNRSSRRGEATRACQQPRAGVRAARV